mgnify:CR=1 FL=1
MRTLRFEPSAAQRCETTPEHCDGGPEGVTSEARNNPSLSAKCNKNNTLCLKKALDTAHIVS